jgi:hypothetical protein
MMLITSLIESPLAKTADVVKPVLENFASHKNFSFLSPAELILGSCGDPEEAKNPSGGRILRLIQIL